MDLRRETLAKLWRPETGVFLGLWLLLMVAGRTQLFRDPGTFWHTAVGERMLASGELVRADPYTYTFAGKPWIAHQWLGEIGMAACDRVGGWDTLLLASVTALAALYAALAVRLIRAGIHWSLAVVLVVLVLAASSYHFHVRPHLATIVLMGVLFGLLVDFEAQRLPLAGLAVLVPLFVVWTNTHGGALGGLATLVIAAGGWFTLWFFSKESPITNWRRFLAVAAICTACGLALLANPFGADMIRAWLSIMTAELPSLIEEHAPLELGSWESWCILLLAGLYLFVLAGTPARRGWPRATWLIPLIWFYLACTRIRHGPLFALTSAVAIADMFPHTRWAAWLVRKGSDWFQPQAGALRFDARAWAVPAALVLSAVVLQATRVPAPVLGTGWVRLDERQWPMELVPELRRLEIDAKGPLFNEFSFGGFLIFFAPNLPVFIDDRCELFLEGDFLAKYAAALAGDRAVLDRWLQEYRFGYALTRPGSPFDQYFQKLEGWSVRRHSAAANLHGRDY